MCKFFSFVIDQDANIRYCNAAYRRRSCESISDFDSHSFICNQFGLDEDYCFKFEWNPKDGFTEIGDKYIELAEAFIERIKDTEFPDICIESNKFPLVTKEQQTPERCLRALSLSGYNLKYIADQNEEYCLAAVKTDAWSIRYAKHQTLKICLAAYKQDPFSVGCMWEKFAREVHHLVYLENLANG